MNLAGRTSGLGVDRSADGLNIPVPLGGNAIPWPPHVAARDNEVSVEEATVVGNRTRHDPVPQAIAQVTGLITGNEAERRLVAAQRLHVMQFEQLPYAPLQSHQDQ